LAFYGMTLC